MDFHSHGYSGLVVLPKGSTLGPNADDLALPGHPLKLLGCSLDTVFPFATFGWELAQNFIARCGSWHSQLSGLEIDFLSNSELVL
jgi:hypothetical protein